MPLSGARRATTVGDVGSGPDSAALPDLEITIDRDAEIPIGVQLAWTLRTRIRDGQLAPNERLPGLRELAAATGVNVNTVRAVYQRLEQEGLINSQQGSGTFVGSAPRRASSVTTIAADAARVAMQTGVDPRDVAAALYISPGSSTAGADRASERRRALRDQIAGLERTLIELEANHPGLVRTAAPTHTDLAPGAARRSGARARAHAAGASAVGCAGGDRSPRRARGGRCRGLLGAPAPAPAPASRRRLQGRSTMRPAAEGA